MCCNIFICSTYLSRIIQVPLEIVQYRKWVKDHFKVPKEQSDSINSTSADAEPAQKDNTSPEIDLVNTDDFPPLQTANPQKDRTVSKNSSVDNAEMKTGTSGSRTGTLYSSVGSANRPKQLSLPLTTKNTKIDSESGKNISAMPDIAVSKTDKTKGECRKGESDNASKESELKPKELDSKDIESKDVESKNVECNEADSPEEDFIDEFIIDPYLSWGEICDDTLAEDDDHKNTTDETYENAEAPIGSGGLSAWSSDEGASHSYSSKEPQRPTYLATGQAQFISHDERHGSGKRYSYHRRNRRPRSPCEGIGEQDLASARHARQLIISSPEKPIIKPEKWAREDTKHHSKDHKVFRISNRIRFEAACNEILSFVCPIQGQKKRCI